MAGNNSIQFLRGSGNSSNATLIPGQPYYDMQNNNLYIGGAGNTVINAATPIGPNIQTYWENAGSGGGTVIRVGDRALIELKDGRVLPALCVDLSYSSGTTWQVSWLGTLQMSDSLTTTWGATDLCKILNSDVLDLFPKYLSDKITSVTKSSGDGDAGISCKLWVPSAEEIWGKDNATFPSWLVKDSNSIFQFVYYRWLLEGDETSTIQANPRLKSSVNSWIRNRHTSNLDWCYLDYNGSLSGGDASYPHGVIFCFTLK